MRSRSMLWICVSVLASASRIGCTMRSIAVSRSFERARPRRLPGATGARAPAAGTSRCCSAGCRARDRRTPPAAVRARASSACVALGRHALVGSERAAQHLGLDAQPLARASRARAARRARRARSRRRPPRAPAGHRSQRARRARASRAGRSGVAMTPSPPQAPPVLIRVRVAVGRDQRGHAGGMRRLHVALAHRPRRCTRRASTPASLAACSSGSGWGLRSATVSPLTTQAKRSRSPSCSSSGSVSQPGLLVTMPSGRPRAASSSSTASMPGNSAGAAREVRAVDLEKAPLQGRELASASASGKPSRTSRAEPWLTEGRTASKAAPRALLAAQGVRARRPCRARYRAASRRDRTAPRATAAATHARLGACGNARDN